MHTNEIKTRPDNPWQRLLYLILFAIIFNLTELLVFIVLIVQFISKLATGKVNQRLSLLGRSLGVYTRQIVEFLTYYSDEKPYPFQSWPSSS